MTYAELREAYGPNAFKLYAHFNFEEQFLDPTKPPRTIQFKTGLEDIKPQQQIIMSGGDVIEAIYYAEEDNGSYKHPLAETVFNWTRIDSGDGDGTTRLNKRIASAIWTLVGDNDDDVIWSSEEENVKSWSKSYDDNTGRIADKRKRSNIIDGLLSQVGPFGVLPYVQAMLEDLSAQRAGYVDTYNINFINSIAAYSGAWLEADVSGPLGLPVSATLRQVIIGALDYDKRFGA